MSIFNPFSWFRSGARKDPIPPAAGSPAASTTVSPAVSWSREPRVTDAFVEGVSIPTLIVVDMQPSFANSQDPNTLAQVADQMKLFVANGWPIVILEFYKQGDTDSRLNAIVESADGSFKYPHFARELKIMNDGSNEAIRVCRKHGFGMSYFRVCGVNTDYCVLETVQGLTFIAPNAMIEVIKEACGPKSSFSGYPRNAKVAVRTLSEAQAAWAARVAAAAAVAQASTAA